MKTIVTILTFVLWGGICHSQDKSFLCRAYGYNFGVLNKYTQDYSWLGDEQSDTFIYFSDNVIDIYCDPPQSFFRTKIIRQDNLATTFEAIDQDGDICEIGVIDAIKGDEYLCVFIRYYNYAYYYNFFIVK